MLVSEVMSRGLISILPDDTVENAARLLHKHNIGALPVCTENGVLRGVVTDRDIALRCIAADFPPSATRVSGIMSRAPVTVDENSDIREAARLMARSQVRRLPVVHDGKVTAMLSLGDLARFGAQDVETGKTLTEISMPSREREY